MQVSLNYDTAVILTTLGIPIGLSFISAAISRCPNLRGGEPSYP